MVIPFRVRLEREPSSARHIASGIQQNVLVVEETPVALDAAKLDPLPFLIGELYNKAG